MFKYIWIIILSIIYIGLWIYCIIDYKKNNNAYKFYCPDHGLGIFIMMHLFSIAFIIMLLFCFSLLTFFKR